MSVSGYLSSKPLVALVWGFIHLTFAHALYTWKIPTLIMQILQCGAWATTISVGIITLYGAYKRRKKLKK